MTVCVKSALLFRIGVSATPSNSSCMNTYLQCLQRSKCPSIAVGNVVLFVRILRG